MVEVYSDETATTLKEKATVDYPVHEVLMNFTKELRQYLIDHGHTLAGVLPVSTFDICL